MLGGAAPIPASSGQTIRYRLNRGGDRQLNCALHTIVLTRLQHDPATRAYAAQRAAEGKTPREIKRCLKRYVARHLFRLLEANGPEHPIATLTRATHPRNLPLTYIEASSPSPSGSAPAWPASASSSRPPPNGSPDSAKPNAKANSRPNSNDCRSSHC